MPDSFRTDEEALRLACMATPDDDAPWGAYADWLRERGRDSEADRMRMILATHRGPQRRLMTAGIFQVPAAPVQRFLPTALPIAEHLDDE